MKIVIIGDGKVGHKLTTQLSEENYDVVLIDQNEGKLKEAVNKLDIFCITGNGADVDLSLIHISAVMLTERMKPELMTCHDIVATGRYPYTGRLGILSREDERKVDEALEAVHAQELGIRNFQEISDGQRSVSYTHLDVYKRQDKYNIAHVKRQC